MDATDTTTRRTLDDIAHQATTDPTKLAPAEITRLGDWYLDHEAHVLAHGRLVGLTVPTQDARRAARAERLAIDEPQPAGDLSKRLAASDPTKQIEQHTTEQPETTT